MSRQDDVEQLAAAVEGFVGRFVSGWVLVAESTDEQGEMHLSRIVSDGCPSWRALGMLVEAQDADSFRDLADDEDD